MGKNQNFETILDTCLELLLTGNGTVEQCLQRYPEYAAELEPLLSTAVSVNKAVNVKPSPEFKARAHYQLQLKMAETGVRKPVSLWRLQPKWALTAMSVMVVFILSSGTVLAANTSMPGSILYPIKIATENVSIKLTGSDINKAELYAALADRRVTEMVYVIEHGKSTYVDGIAEKYDTTMSAIDSLALSTGPVLTMAASGANELGATGVARETTQTAPVAAPSVASTMPDNTDKSQLKTAENTDKAVATPTPETITETTIASILSDKEKLKQYIAYNAIHHPEKLQELLNIAPASSRAAINKMIATSIEKNRQTLTKLDD